MLVFLFFLIFSAFVWFIMTMSDEYETEIDIPIEIVGLPQGTVLTTTLPTALTTTVKEKGSRILMDYKLHHLPTLQIDFQAYSNHEGHVLISQNELIKRIAAQLLATTKVISVKPDSIAYSYAHGIAKRVPIKLLPGSIKMAPQYYLASVEFTPKYAVVYAAESMMDTINAVYVAPELTTTLHDTITTTLQPIAISGARIYTHHIQARFCAIQFTEKTVEVPITSLNFPADKVLRTFPSKVNVTFQVATTDFERITADDFVISVTYEELMKLGSEKLPLTIKSIPKGAHRVSINPSSVDYLIENRQ